MWCNFIARRYMVTCGKLTCSNEGGGGVARFSSCTYVRARALRNLPGTQRGGATIRAVYHAYVQRIYVSKRTKCMQQKQHTFPRHSSYFIYWNIGGGGQSPPCSPSAQVTLLLFMYYV